MVRALILYCHPNESSLTAAVRDVVLARLAAAGAEVRLRDLYGEGFEPVLSARELSGYLDAATNRDPVAEHVADLLWCDTLIFIYPTWWAGLPAMLKGWLDRVLLPGVAFTLPAVPGGALRPGLGQIARIGVFTTHGASWWVARLTGEPGRKMLLRGVGWLLKPRARTVHCALHRADGASGGAVAAHLRRVAGATDKLIAR